MQNHHFFCVCLGYLLLECLLIWFIFFIDLTIWENEDGLYPIKESLLFIAKLHIGYSIYMKLGGYLFTVVTGLQYLGLFMTCETCDGIIHYIVFSKFTTSFR